jgi:hypothetical protein
MLCVHDTSVGQTNGSTKPDNVRGSSVKSLFRKARFATQKELNRETRSRVNKGTNSFEIVLVPSLETS